MKRIEVFFAQTDLETREYFQAIENDGEEKAAERLATYCFSAISEKELLAGRQEKRQEFLENFDYNDHVVIEIPEVVGKLYFFYDLDSWQISLFWELSDKQFAELATAK